VGEPDVADVGIACHALPLRNEGIDDGGRIVAVAFDERPLCFRGAGYRPGLTREQAAQRVAHGALQRRERHTSNNVKLVVPKMGSSGCQVGVAVVSFIRNCAILARIEPSLALFWRAAAPDNSNVAVNGADIISSRACRPDLSKTL
jgi:hypothetical protein